jgi:hypothetical protein
MLELLYDLASGRAIKLRGTHNRLGSILVGLNGLGDVKDVGLVEEHDGEEYSNKWLWEVEVDVLCVGWGNFSTTMEPTFIPFRHFAWRLSVTENGIQDLE